MSSRSGYRKMLHDIALELFDFFSPLFGSSMSKLIEDPHGNFVLTSDGTTILRELSLRYKHPIASIFFQAADTQAKQCGDLVKMTIIIASSLVISGIKLIEQGVHPNIVRSGFNKAKMIISNIIKARKQFPEKNKNDVEARVSTFLTQQLAQNVARHLASLISGPIIEALSSNSIAQALSNFDEKLHVIIHQGGNVGDSFTESGVVIIKTPVIWNDLINESVNAKHGLFKIALVSGELYYDKKKIEKCQFQIDGSVNIKHFNDELKSIWARRSSKLQNLGVNFLITEKGIDDELISNLAILDPPIVVIRRVKIEEMKRLAKHSGGRIVYDIDHLEDVDVGIVNFVKIQKIRDEKCLIFFNEYDPTVKTLIIRGSIYDVCDAVKHLVSVASRVECLAIFNGIVSHFPSIFEDLIKNARSIARMRPGTLVVDKEWLALDAFINSIANVPRLIQVNHGNEWFDPLAASAMDQEVPVSTVESMLSIATNTATNLLCIDNLVVNPVGWQKRMGMKRNSEKKQELQDSEKTQS